TLYTLILPALFILTQLRGRRRVQLGALWVGAVLVASAWWLAPLLLQAKYSFNFLPFVEQATTTTATMSGAAFLRGAGNWTAYLNFGQPWLQAGWVMVAYPFAIMAAAVAAATGLVGLSRRDLPYSGWLRLSLGIAALIALAGYPGPLGGIFHHPVDQLLDGIAAPLRSVYKVEPVAAVVLGLGIAHALVLRTKRAALVADSVPRTLWHFFAAPAIALVLLGMAYPQISGQVLNAGSFKAIPDYWDQAATYLKEHSPRSPALVVPAAEHGVFTWGEPVDEPLEPLASSPWTAQGLVPYGGAGSAMLLRSVQAAINSGERIPGLAATLSRSGIGYVLVRNDLSPASIGYTPPQLVHQALASSGYKVVASFGPAITAQGGPGSLQPSGVSGGGAVQPQIALPSYPAIEIFAPSLPSADHPPPAAVALPVSQTVLVNGGPDALLQLTGQRVLAQSAPAVIAGDPLPVRPAEWAVTDSFRRADNAFGSIDPTASYTYTAAERNPPSDPLGSPGGEPRQLLPVSAPGHQTVAVLSGAAAVTASSSGSWLGETPEIDPVNVFDGNPDTDWTEADPTSAAGQWVQITFDRRLVLPRSAMITLLDDIPSRPVASRLTVRTDAGSVTSTAERTGAPQPLRLPAGPTRTLRITIASARGGVPGGLGAGIAGVKIPGVKVTRLLRPAQDPAGRRAPSTAFSFDQSVPSPASLANVAAYPQLARTFEAAKGGRFSFGGTAMAVPGKDLDAILTSLTPVRRKTLQVTASSTYGSLPSLTPANLFRRHDPGAWIAGSQHASLTLSWRGMRTIRRMVIQPLPGIAAAPESIKITSPEGVRYASVGLGGQTAIVPPLRTNQMTISFPVVQYATSAQPISGQPVRLPVGLSRLSIPALDGLRPAAPVRDANFTLPCGSGPTVRLDGKMVRTRVSGKVGSLIAFEPVRVRLCRANSALWLAPGPHRLLADRPKAFTMTGLRLVDASPGGLPGGQQGQNLGSVIPGQNDSSQGRTVGVLGWSEEHRRLRVGPGPESYLELHQNENAGWTATMNGKTLRPVRLDGWQQGFVMPAGKGGVVTLSFAPVKFYHVWIILSAAGVLGLVLVAIAGGRRRRASELRGRVREQMEQATPAAAPRLVWESSPQNTQNPAYRPPEWTVQQPPSTGSASQPPWIVQGTVSQPLWTAQEPASQPSSTVQGPSDFAWFVQAPASQPSQTENGSSPQSAWTEQGPASQTATRDRGPASQRQALTPWLALLALTLLIAIVGGPLALAVPVVAALAYRWPSWFGGLAAAGMVAAGVLTALASHPALPGTGAFGAPAQACALIALTCALMPVLPGKLPGGLPGWLTDRLGRR
ncbi:MAG: alpha-(1-_3)-arabinofuranosyltransferase family protein, partial [Nocardiopsaceae bacterium]|nr:alpha-(1->3)-arabinofuranosyltransferase family protein [Nocardiopsaceae bacterium]